MEEQFKQIPEFGSEEEERKFWATHDSTEYVDWDSAENMVLPKLKASTKTISRRPHGKQATHEWGV